MEIKRVPLASLHEDPNNARKHGERNLEAIGGSLSEFGQVEPLVVQKGTGKVIGGNGRLAVMRSQGDTDAFVVEVEVDDPTATKLGIALNRTAELAEWDLTRLDSITKELGPDAMDAIGFDADELAKTLVPVRAHMRVVDPESPSPPENPTTKPGELWVLGRHRLICADSRDASAIAPVFGGASPAIMVTDPPYGVELDLEWRGRAGVDPLGVNRTGKVHNDDEASWPEVWRESPSTIAYVWHASAFSDVVMTDLRDAGFDVRQQIIWAKDVMVLSRSAHHWQHEPCWYAVRKNNTASWIGGRSQTTLWQAPSPSQIMGSSTDDKTPHPTQKPIELFAKSIRNHKGDVYDPFAGSGTAIVASEQLERSCFCVELSPAYCDVIIERWQNLTGGKATRKSA